MSEADSVDPLTGLSAFADTDIASDERLISCPFAIAVTPELARTAICAAASIEAGDLFWPAGTSKAGERWNDRMLIGAYLGLHWVYEDELRER